MIIKVRGLTADDYEAALELDGMSGDSLADSYFDNLEQGETSDYAWGLFVDGKLVGYCSIGYADCVTKMIQKHPHFKDTCDQLLLSDVYVQPLYRSNCLGQYLVSEALRSRWDIEGPNVSWAYLTVLHDDLGHFYQKLGFEWCDASRQYAMALDLNKLTVLNEPSL